MSEPAAVWRLAPHATWQPVGAGAVALNLKTGEYYRLNQVASRALALLEGDCTLKDLVARLQGVFDVQPAALAADLRALLDDLEAKGLIARAGERAC